jgi:hypothetical protein
MAVHGRSGVQEVAISELQERLREHGGILHLREEFSGGGMR